LRLADQRKWTAIPSIFSLDARFQLYDITTILHPDMDINPVVAL
jgi:hypothetical protein